MLGKETLIAPSHRGANGNERCDLSSEERIFTLLTAAYGKPVHAAVFGKLERASELWAEGEKCLAQIHLAQSGLPKIETEEQTFRLFLADRLMELETTPSEICKALGYALPEGLKKYDPDQPRDAHGRWGTGGGKESGQAGSSSRSDGTLTEGRSAAAPNKEPKTPASTPPPEKHVRRIDIQISGGTRQDSATGGIIPGALYAQLARQPIVTEEVLDKIVREHGAAAPSNKGRFSAEYATKEGVKDLIEKAWAKATPASVAAGRWSDGTAVIGADVMVESLETGAKIPYIIGVSGSRTNAPSVPTNTYVVVIDSNMNVKTCYPINPIDSANPRATIDRSDIEN